MKLTNSYCEGIEKSFKFFQSRCPTCGLWTIFRHKKTGEWHRECTCVIKDGDKNEICE